MIAPAEGSTLRYDGGSSVVGRVRAVWVMAACTSAAAASMSRVRSNCSVMLVDPCRLDDVIALSPAMVENCFSSGVATDEAIVSGLAPGNDAPTEMVG